MKSEELMQPFNNLSKGNDIKLAQSSGLSLRSLTTLIYSVAENFQVSNKYILEKSSRVFGCRKMPVDFLTIIITLEGSFTMCFGHRYC